MSASAGDIQRIGHSPGDGDGEKDVTVAAHPDRQQHTEDIHDAQRDQLQHIRPAESVGLGHF
jgi:hypothetical protein